MGTKRLHRPEGAKKKTLSPRRAPQYPSDHRKRQENPIPPKERSKEAGCEGRVRSVVADLRRACGAPRTGGDHGLSPWRTGALEEPEGPTGRGVHQGAAEEARGQDR